MSTNTLTLPLVLVLIDRGKTVISKAVPEHEVRVLKAIHKGKVQTGDLAADMEPEGQFHPNAHMELARLHACYRPDKDGGDNGIDRAFPNGAEDLVAFGFSLGDESELAKQPRSISVNHGLEKRQKAAAERRANKAKKESKGEK